MQLKSAMYFDWMKYLNPEESKVSLSTHSEIVFTGLSKLYSLETLNVSNNEISQVSDILNHFL